jgi:NAD(P)-dependent dehydrogenase (short-subunit alcohol dehydrogenase family)
MQLKPIHQQVVVIAGASSGIGRETARLFAQQEIHAEGGEAVAIPADVSDFEQVQAIADKAVATYGRLDTWVHMAAVGLFAPFEQITPEEFKRVIEVNLLGQVYGAMVALPHLRREGRGALIHVSSMEGRRSLPLQSPYSASKHGLEGFVESLRVELQHEGIPISVTSVLPATINTPFYKQGRTKLGVQPTGIPPYYQPEEVAKAIVYVAEHPTRDFIVGDAGRLLDLAQRVSPQLVDMVLAVVGIPGQHTQQQKAESAPDNLFEPIADYNSVEGGFSHLAVPSVTDWLERHPTVKWGAIGGTMALALLATQVFKTHSPAQN